MNFWCDNKLLQNPRDIFALNDQLNYNFEKVLVFLIFKSIIFYLCFRGNKI